MSDTVTTIALLVTGLLMVTGLAVQFVTGMRMHKGPSAQRRRVHKVAGYVVIAIVLVHLPVGITHAIATFMP